MNNFTSQLYIHIWRAIIISMVYTFFFRHLANRLLLKFWHFLDIGFIKSGFRKKRIEYFLLYSERYDRFDFKRGTGPASTQPYCRFFILIILKRSDIFCCNQSIPNSCWRFTEVPSKSTWGFLSFSRSIWCWSDEFLDRVLRKICRYFTLWHFA